MVITPKTRGFYCTNAHPTGCAENVRRAVEYAAEHVCDEPKRVLIIGSSTGYGLGGRIAAAFGSGAATMGVFLEREATSTRTASAGWYNNHAFEQLAAEAGLICPSINADAFAQTTKEQVVSRIRSDFPGGQVDLVIYSVAAPRRTDPVTGETHLSLLKPIGKAFEGYTIDFHTGQLVPAVIEPATPEETEGTVAVMGGADWLLWMQALSQAGVLAPGAVTLALSYIGPEMTHPVYTNGTIGQAKKDLELKAKVIDRLLEEQGGKAFVVVNKALVTQASAAIPVVPLYVSVLYQVMKEKGTHEECTEQMVRLQQCLYANGAGNWEQVPVDEAGRVRMDDWEMDPEVQAEVTRRWALLNDSNLAELSDLEGYRKAFYQLFGFEVDGIDYQADVAL
jgi:Uncharacterized paraquat-inducible protein B